jgi:hypothetical protein
MFFFHSLLLSAVVGSAVQVVSAASISSQCKSTLITLADSPDAECIDASALTGLLLQGTDSSIISPVDNWLHGLCSVGSCTDTTLAFLVTNVTSGCGPEMSAIFGSLSSSQLTSLVQEGYPTVRNILCLEDTSDNDELCVTQTLTNVQATTGTFTLSEVSSLLNTVIGGATLGLPQNTTCTSCTQESYNIANADFPALVGSENSTVQNTCGADFTDGSTPSGIVQTASNTIFSSSSSVNGGSSLSGFQPLVSSIFIGCLVLAVIV